VRGSALTEFLQSRRARITPEQAGLVDGGGRRRVEGLRREELAHLAGMSVDYYVRLEQGRTPNVSDAVLDAVATALRLGRDERAHMFLLARPHLLDPVPVELGVRQGVRQLLDWIAAPALVVGHRLDVLAWNRLAAALFGDFGQWRPVQRNLARLHLLAAAGGGRFPDRAVTVRELVAHLRTMAGRYPDDVQLSELVDELRTHSVEFRREWDLHPVRTKSHGTLCFVHPELDRITLFYEIARLPQDSEQMLIVFTGAPGSEGESALRRLSGAVTSDLERGPVVAASPRS
jgi:transcriptional regulator with XRE-family HTH domain